MRGALWCPPHWTTTVEALVIDWNILRPPFEAVQGAFLLFTLQSTCMYSVYSGKDKLRGNRLPSLIYQQCTSCSSHLVGEMPSSTCALGAVQCGVVPTRLRWRNASSILCSFLGTRPPSRRCSWSSPSSSSSPQSSYIINIVIIIPTRRRHNYHHCHHTLGVWYFSSVMFLRQFERSSVQILAAKEERVISQSHFLSVCQIFCSRWKPAWFWEVLGATMFYCSIDATVCQINGRT